MLHDHPSPAPEPDDILAAALPGLSVARVTAPASGPWLAGAGADAPLFRLTRSAGQPCLWHPERLVAIAGDLDRAAALLDQVEAASGWRFEPARCLPAPEAGATLVAVSDEETTLELALAGELPRQLRDTADAAPLRGDRPVPVRLSLSGPALPVEQAAALAPGDLLLLPAVAPVRIDGRTPSAPDALLSLELATGLLTRAAWGGDAPGTGSERFAVPVAIGLPPALIAPDALARAGEGAPVSLGPVREGAEVTLAVGGRPLGAGTIVRLGDRLAVALAAPPALDPVDLENTLS